MSVVPFKSPALFAPRLSSQTTASQRCRCPDTRVIRRCLMMLQRATAVDHLEARPTADVEDLTPNPHAEFANKVFAGFDGTRGSLRLACHSEVVLVGGGGNGRTLRRPVRAFTRGVGGQSARDRKAFTDSAARAGYVLAGPQRSARVAARAGNLRMAVSLEMTTSVKALPCTRVCARELLLTGYAGCHWVHVAGGPTTAETSR
ncbi:hypothetical protein C7974DRAFT_453906 [Boeremia exigua]|uniref:uncharacterized protein n=1 Tax=Boeremia exigua TaxID=749465 RepID=UPI001E8D1DDA|nr:uncharacterized protein C7974DRAFT_453906 [Boeremia exigua]KAH6629268.1 hypothetical protein C7974DRAFT_453906 [Boeremia exigua]